ncbi:tetratricopeptide repeat protein 8 isoform X4 [Rattus norvegicus]|nr:tetratricopeptide repeat protein 8 isoform X5 [Rattus norvegicus]
MGSEMEPLFRAWSYFRRRKFQLCADLCTQMLEKSPYDQAAWILKARALTEMVYVDEIDVDQEGIAEMTLDENAIAQVPRPGTSLKLPGTNQTGGPTQAVRPITQAGRPITGFLRPSTQSGRPGTMEQAIRTPRTAYTARPITSSSGRFVRLGTASMLTSPDGPFINLSRLNLTKYSQKPKLAKALFEYIFHHENDVKMALDLASLSTEYSQYKDWWWKVQIGKCYYRLGMYREAEKQFKSALKQQEMVDTFLYLAKMEKNQPEVWRAGSAVEALVSLPEDPGLRPNNHLMAHNHLNSSSKNLLLVSKVTRHTHDVQTYT